MHCTLLLKGLWMEVFCQMAKLGDKNKKTNPLFWQILKGMQVIIKHKICCVVTKHFRVIGTQTSMTITELLTLKKINKN